MIAISERQERRPPHGLFNAGRRLVAIPLLFSVCGALAGADDADDAENGKPLTIGSRAPSLTLGSFVCGEAVHELRRGVVHVVEFSGTECVSCVRALPHLTAVQKKHPEVVILSVYGESKESVRSFVEKHQDAIGFRVAVDRDAATELKWMTAASLLGIPKAFLVDGDGTIAWIGSPFGLADAIEHLLQGSLDTRLDRIRLRFEQEEVASTLKTERRMEQSRAIVSRVRELIAARNWPAAIQAVEQGAKGFPETACNLNLSKVYALAVNPETVDSAIAFAARLSAETRGAWGDLAIGRRGRGFEAEIAQSLLPRENDDARLVEAAMILLRKGEENVVAATSETDRLSQRIYLDQVFALAHAQRREFGKAAERLRSALGLLKQRTFSPGTGVDRDDWEREQRGIVAELEAKMADYLRASGTQK